MANPPLGVQPPSLPSVPDISAYIDVATKQLNPGFGDILDAVTKQGQQQAAGFQKLAADTLSGESIVQKTYGDLSNEFKVEQDIEAKQAEEIGKARIGEAKVAGAAAGVTAGQGSFRAPVTGAENDLTSTIATIAEKYGAKQEDIANTLTASIQQIQQKADEYLIQGNNTMADTLTQVAQLKYQQQQQITGLAQQMQSAQTTYEQNTWKDYMDMVSAQHQQATLDVMLARLSISDRNASLAEKRFEASQSTPQVTVNKDGGYGFYDKTGNPIDAASYAKLTNRSITQVLSGSKDPKDVEFVQNYNEWMKQIATGGATKEQAQAALGGLYPEIMGTSGIF